MKRDKLDTWAHEHAEDIELMYWEHGLRDLRDVEAEGVRRAAAR